MGGWETKRKRKSSKKYRIARLRHEEIIRSWNDTVDWAEMCRNYRRGEVTGVRTTPEPEWPLGSSVIPPVPRKTFHRKKKKEGSVKNIGLQQEERDWKRKEKE